MIYPHAFSIKTIQVKYCYFSRTSWWDFYLYMRQFFNGSSTLPTNTCPLFIYFFLALINTEAEFSSLENNSTAHQGKLELAHVSARETDNYTPRRPFCCSPVWEPHKLGKTRAQYPYQLCQVLNHSCIQNKPSLYRIYGKHSNSFSL